jgi:hypothetical protein
MNVDIIGKSILQKNRPRIVRSAIAEKYTGQLSIKDLQKNPDQK